MGFSRRGTARLLSGSASAAVLLWAFQTQAAEIEKPVQFNITATDLGPALNQLARQSHRQIIFASRTMAGKMARPLQGNFTPTEALENLLMGTGVEYRISRDNTIIVSLTERATEAAPPLPFGGPITAVKPPLPPPALAPLTFIDDILEEIIVSASRLLRIGFEAPTPVTVTSSDELQAAASPTLGDYLQRLPPFGSSLGSRNPSFSTSSGSAGISLINLRQMGVARTLVLFDGRRVVNANLVGGVDMNLIPDSLVQRIDVVTGGASATWGSDAVAGVVNVIVDKEFQGIEAKAELSISDYGDAFTHKEDISGGGSFAGGKGHAVASFAYTDTPFYTRAGNRPWFNPSAVIPNPAYAPGNGQPRFVIRDNRGAGFGTAGGLITAGPLKNTQFKGPNGGPVPYVVEFAGGTVAIGDDAEKSTLRNKPLIGPTRNYNFYSYTTYALNDTLTGDIELNYGEVRAKFETLHYARYGTGITITSDNAYLPAQTRAAMAAAGITSFVMGTNNLNLGAPGSNNNRKLWRGVVGLNGKVFDDWTWKAYYEHGQVRNYSRLFKDPLVPNYNLAIDAVRNPASGQIVCRSTLTNPNNGCKPLNLFGNGVASAEAIEYINGITPFQRINTGQDVAAFSIAGIPFSSWAGAVDIAAGIESRWERAEADSDPLSQQRLYYAGNFAALAPVRRNVTEGFVETTVPLARETSWARSLDFNAGLRVTNYSTSGTVTTWKAGLNYQATDAFRFRVTRSRDIRAPTLNELFTPGQLVATTAYDPVRDETVQAVINNGNNANLAPEIGSTWTAGAIYSPQWLLGFQTSIDYYRIHVTDAIQAPQTQAILEGCFLGRAEFCALIQRDANGALFQINQIPVNISAATVSGIDVESGYRTTIGRGEASFRLIGSYTFEFSRLENGIYVDNAGSVSTNTPNAVEGVPKLKLTARAQYSLAPFSVGMEAQYLGPAKLNRYWTAETLADADNHVSDVVYLNLRAAYDFAAFETQAHLYASVDNLLNTDPPRVSPIYTGFTNYDVSTRPGFYDQIGRMYRIGLRTRF